MKEELIGSDIKIIESKNKTLVGLNGKVIDETKNMLTLETKDGIKKVIKKTIKFKLNDKIIDGKKISKRPEDRLKK